MPRGRHDQPGAEDGRGSPTAEEEKEDAAKLKTMEPSKLTEGMFQSLLEEFKLAMGGREGKATMVHRSAVFGKMWAPSRLISLV